MLMIVGLGWLDTYTGYELNFFIFYLIPVWYGAWKLGFKRGGFIAVLSAVSWFVSDRLAGHAYTNWIYWLWNTVIRLGAFMIVAYAVSRIHLLLLKEQHLSRDLQRTLDEVRTLKGLIPICAACKKIKDDKGYWHQVEEYISKHTDAKFTHGYCQQCMEKMLKEAGLDPEPEAGKHPAA
jgi:hypothetical protein